jgi:anti-sigma factor (TIGR02949 family)
MKCSDEVIEYMHELLDGEISPDNEQLLREHLGACTECQEHFNQLSKVAELVREASFIQAPPDFTAKVMANLPKKGQKAKWRQWMQYHPLLTAVSLFLVLMTGGMISSYQKDQSFSVSENQNLVVKDQVVMVPKGKTVQGDIVVKNGELRVEGEIRGNVTIINGTKYVASAGHVSGEIEEINEAYDWIWYKIKSTSKQIFSIFK